MLQSLLATVPSTLAGLGAWLAARREPKKLTRVEAGMNELLEWTAKHERRHYRLEGDSR